MSPCSVDGCNQKHFCKGLCRYHFHRSPEERARRRNYMNAKVYGTKESNAYYRNYRKLPKAKIRSMARRAVQTAIAKGRLIRLPCRKCGKASEAHHPSYEKEQWLNVQWLCKSHHDQWHENNEPTYPLPL